MKQILSTLLFIVGVLFTIVGIIYTVLAYARYTRPGGSLAVIGIIIGIASAILGVILLFMSKQLHAKQF